MGVSELSFEDTIGDAWRGGHGSKFRGKSPPLASNGYGGGVGCREGAHRRRVDTAGAGRAEREGGLSWRPPAIRAAALPAYPRTHPTSC
eukprot:NODE_4629_length_565_cov_24.625969_g3370_i0.p3 GENE.NODE_4629_length_565_cov_24.625969_g3370_i0~~NODE_4629_length_565_cov_24.625969_g3370_i0.p3  ORF type:complete len:89 (-),score=15.20 NODE_4629_length_565_cov_24.625969_g3370_i0:73-339(-)